MFLSQFPHFIGALLVMSDNGSERETSILYIHFQLTLLPILTGLDVNRFFYLVGISLFGRYFGGLGQSDHQNVNIEKNNCGKGISLRQTASFEPLRVKLSLYVWPV